MSHHCPRCDSPSPKLHPAVQFEGEQLCRHQWHKPTADEIEAAIGMCPWCGESLHPGRRCSNEDYMEEQR